VGPPNTSIPVRRVITALAILLVAGYAAMLWVLFFEAWPDVVPSAVSTQADSVASPSALHHPRARTKDQTRESGAGDATQIDGNVRNGSLALTPVTPVAVSPTTVVIASPARIEDGATFEVLVRVPRTIGARSAHVRLAYEDEALEVLDMTDPTGATVPASRAEAGSIDLNFDLSSSRDQAFAIRFLARTGAPREVRISAVSELRDSGGKVLPSSIAAPNSIWIE
jgi:hypothetical protein